MSALILQQVTLRADDRDLFAPVSISVEPGEVASIIGPSGAGKSSLLAFVSGVLSPGLAGRGRVLIGDQDVASLPAQARRLGMLFQDPLLFPHLSVRAICCLACAIPARDANGPRRWRRRWHRSISTDLVSRDPATLSGGQKARVALLRVLLSRPRALLLDEPFGALDDDNRQRVRQRVFDAATQYGLPTLLVTHDKEDVAAAGGPVIALNGGTG